MLVITFLVTDALELLKQTVSHENLLNTFMWKYVMYNIARE